MFKYFRYGPTEAVRIHYCKALQEVVGVNTFSGGYELQSLRDTFLAYAGGVLNPAGGIGSAQGTELHPDRSKL